VSEESTHDALLAKYVQAMGSELAEVFDALDHRLTWAHVRWVLYRQLYATSDRRIELLNDTAASFFAVLQRVLFNDVVLELARLTDKLKSAGKANLTIRSLPALVPDPQLLPDVTRLVDAAVDSCAAIRDRRNRQLAHDDLALALATADDPLEGISRADIETALRAIREVLNYVQLHFLGSTTGYEYVLTAPGDGDVGVQ